MAGSRRHQSFGQFLPVSQSARRAGPATVDDVVDAVIFFANASYVTGEVLSVDGGIRFAK